MQRDIVTRRVMTKFTQIPQVSEELRICFNKDTRRNGIMTSLRMSYLYSVIRLMQSMIPLKKEEGKEFCLEVYMRIGLISMTSTLQG